MLKPSPSEEDAEGQIAKTGRQLIDVVKSRCGTISGTYSPQVMTRREGTIAPGG